MQDTVTIDYLAWLALSVKADLKVRDGLKKIIGP
jgi:hypothetical protein